MKIFEIKSQPLNQEIRLTAKIIVSEIFNVTDHALQKMREALGTNSSVFRVSEIEEQTIASSPSPHLTKRSIGYGGSVIVDVGGIGNLVKAIPYEQQKFSTLDVAQSLIENGFIDPKKTALKMGTSGAVVEGNAAEIIEMQLIKGGELFPLTKASSSKDGTIQTDRINNPDRVLLENEFIVQPTEKEKSKAIFIRINVDNPVDVYQLLAKAAQEAGMSDWTIRGTAYGPLKADVAVIKELPDKPLVSMDDVKNVLVVGNQSSDNPDNIFHFFGSRSEAFSRQDGDWGKITGNNVYSPLGHVHGYSENGQMGGHIRSLIPQKGAVVEMIIEPAKVVQVVKS